MKNKQFLFEVLTLVIFATILPGIPSYGENTKIVNFYQRAIEKPIDPNLPIGDRDESGYIRCVLYQESRRCEFNSNIENIQTYEIYNTSGLLGIYDNEANFVNDVFRFKGILILSLYTKNSQFSGRVYN